MEGEKGWGGGEREEGRGQIEGERLGEAGGGNGEGEENGEEEEH